MSRAPRNTRKHSKRLSSHDRGYDKHWKRIRGIHLRKFPDCVVCGLPGNEVDHIQPISERPDLRLSMANLRTLCKKHHSRRTVIDQGWHKGKAISVPAGADGLPADPLHPWNTGK